MDRYVSEEEEGRKKRFGLSIQHTPCLRTAIITGLSSSMFFGLAQFFHSGVVRRAVVWSGFGWAFPFSGYLFVCTAWTVLERKRFEEQLLQKARGKEDALRTLFGEEAMNTYDTMFQEARNAELKKDQKNVP